MKAQLTLKEIQIEEQEQAKLYVCTICKRLARKIKLSACGHIFCKNCITGYYSNSKMCKACNLELKDDEIVNGVFLDDYLNSNFHCNCVNKSFGCTWYGTVGNFYKEHIMNCPIITNINYMNDDDFILEIPIEEEKSKDTNQDYKKTTKSMTDGECNEYLTTFDDDDSFFEDGGISKLQCKTEYSTIHINISEASMNNPFVYLFPFYITNQDKLKYSLKIIKRDYHMKSIITLGLSPNKSEYYNYISSNDCDFFTEGETITVEYDNIENKLIISSPKGQQVFNNVIQEDFIKKQCFYYPFIVSTSPDNAFELHIYNI